MSLFCIKGLQDQRMGRKHLAVNWHQTSSDKSSFYSQDEWLQEIEERERKPDTSEKQSVLQFG